MNFLLWKIVANALTVGSGVGSGVGCGVAMGAGVTGSGCE